jgi:hypothetical protein
MRLVKQDRNIRSKVRRQQKNELIWFHGTEKGQSWSLLCCNRRPFQPP